MVEYVLMSRITSFKKKINTNTSKADHTKSNWCTCVLLLFWKTSFTVDSPSKSTRLKKEIEQLKRSLDRRFILFRFLWWALHLIRSNSFRMLNTSFNHRPATVFAGLFAYFSVEFFAFPFLWWSCVVSVFMLITNTH